LLELVEVFNTGEVVPKDGRYPARLPFTEWSNIADDAHGMVSNSFRLLRGTEPVVEYGPRLVAGFVAGRHLSDVTESLGARVPTATP
jgi:hypothetical protein